MKPACVSSTRQSRSWAVTLGSPWLACLPPADSPSCGHLDALSASHRDDPRAFSDRAHTDRGRSLRIKSRAQSWLRSSESVPAFGLSRAHVAGLIPQSPRLCGGVAARAAAPRCRRPCGLDLLLLVLAWLKCGPGRVGEPRCRTWPDPGNNIPEPASVRRSRCQEGCMCTEGEARRIIGVEGAQTLVDIVEGAWQSYLDERRVRTRRTRANIVWEYMIAGATAQLKSMVGVREVLVHGSPAYVLCDRLLLRLKKHSADLFTTNVPTVAQTNLALQGFFDGMEDLPHISCGYVLDAAEAGVKSVVAVRQVAGRVEWWIDLHELGSGELGPTAPTLIFGGDGPIAPLPSIARPAHRKEGTED